VTPLLLGYGNVVMGDTSVLGVTIQNSGAADLSVTSIAFGRGSSADFAISSSPSLPVTIGAGGSYRSDDRLGRYCFV
jgi:hypothetical protein